MTLTILGVLIVSVSFISLIIFGSYFLGHVHMLFGFENKTKETEATIKGFISRGLDDFGNPRGAHPIIEYYNEFLAQNVEKEMFNSRMIASRDAVTKGEKMRVVNAGDKIKVQYTTKKVRVIDSRFVTDNTYKISRFILPIIASLVVGFVGFFVLVVSIVM